VEIAVTGASGLVGSALVPRLQGAGHRVAALVRGEGHPPPPGCTPITWDPTEGTIDVAALEGVDAVVHLAGEGIAEKRWTPDQKARILQSRVKGTALVARTLAALQRPPSVLLSASAIGFYGDTGDVPTDEAGPPGDDFPAEVCRQWEQETHPAEKAGIRVAHLRTGIVLSADGGALAKQLLPFRLGLGGRAGSGRQWMSWIHIADEVGAIEHLLTAEVSGPVNLTSPRPVTNAEFTKALGRALHRPTTVLPMAGPRLLYGRELADSLLLTSQRIVPAVLERSGYAFAHPDLDGALSDLLA
jgi:hypothetical protein